MPTSSREMKHLSSRLDLNRASEQELAQVPELGPERARRIVEFRSQQGGFRSFEDLRGILDPATFDQLRASLAAENAERRDPPGAQE
jgi:DNA uptake protein ComE-like DNA-binding protein